MGRPCLADGEEQLVLQSSARFGDGWYKFALYDSITDQDELCGGRKEKMFYVGPKPPNTNTGYV